jgi:KaiC/GvpD/RAD55 family RecA-like ATPase
MDLFKDIQEEISQLKNLQVKKATYHYEIKCYSNTNIVYYGQAGASKTTHALNTAKFLLRNNIIPNFAYIDLDTKDISEAMAFLQDSNTNNYKYVSTSFNAIKNKFPKNIDLIKYMSKILPNGALLIIDPYSKLTNKENDNDEAKNTLVELKKILDAKQQNYLMVAHSSKESIDKGVRGATFIEGEVAYMVGFERNKPCIIRKDSFGVNTGKFFELSVSEGEYLFDRMTTTSELKDEVYVHTLTEKEIRDMFKLKVLKGRIAQAGERIFKTAFSNPDNNKVVKLSSFETYILQSANTGIDKLTNEEYLTPHYIKSTLPLLLQEMLDIKSIKVNEKGAPIKCITYIDPNTFLNLFSNEELKYRDVNFTFPGHLEKSILDLIIDIKTIKTNRILKNNKPYTDEEHKFITNYLNQVDSIKKTELRDYIHKNSKLFSRRRADSVLKNLLKDGKLVEKKDGKAIIIKLKETK